MRYPWVNISLFILLFIQTVTGYFGLTNGQDPAAWVLWVHGIGAYGLFVLLFLKASIILDTWRRKKRWTVHRYGFVLLLVLFVTTMVSGIIWTFDGPIYLGGFSLVSLHIYVSIPLMVMMVWHAWHLRFIRRVPGAVGRRLFLGTLAIAAVGGLLWQTTKVTKAWLGLKGAERRFTGSYEIGSFTPKFPVVSWIADRPPAITAEQWELVVEGAVGNQARIDYGMLRAMPLTTIAAALDCTGGWYTVQWWQGVRVGDVLDRVGIRPEAASVTITSLTGYKRRFDLDQARDYLLALGTGDGPEASAFFPLSAGHGAPVRLVAPGKRGMEWVKWVGHIRVNETSEQWQSPLPLQ